MLKWPFSRTAGEGTQLAVPRPGEPGPAMPRVGFEARLIHEVALRTAHEPRTHQLVDVLAQRVVPRVLDRLPDVPARDLPHLRTILVTAAQLGVGVALSQSPAHPDLVETSVQAALALALDDLPAMSGIQRQWAWFMILAGHYAGRRGALAVTHIDEALDLKAP